MDAKWEWLKHYRVWDSNRKIFLHPENWIEPELRLPGPVLLSLDEIVASATKPVRKTARTKGVRVLFTGKDRTTALVAAKTLASAIGVALHRVDLRDVVSKYLGETEKNLSRIFDAAERNAIVFFDEADALFGGPREGEDSHDRYANRDVRYLLERMGHRSGVTILSVANKGIVHRTFLRELCFIIRLPAPKGRMPMASAARVTLPPKARELVRKEK